MIDPLHPTLMTRMRAALAGERDTVYLEALRSAGRVAYDELMAAERLRAELAGTGTSLWDAEPAVGSQLLASWNAFVLQTVGETVLDADYAANPHTVGYVPPVTLAQASAWLSAVEGWVSRARQARSNPDYDIAVELDLPAALPDWVEVEPCPPEHLAALQAAIPPVREHVEVALFALDRAGVPERHRHAVNRLRQMAAEAGAAADYAAGLRTAQHHPRLHELIEENLKNALELWFQVGQLAAMPQLLSGYRRWRTVPRVDPACLPGGAAFDPWCLTDPATRASWKHDPKARQAIKEMWQYDPDPGATLAMKAEIDEALAAGDIVALRLPTGNTCFFECPWSALYEVRRPVRIGGRSLKLLQHLALRVAADNVLTSGRFEREIIVGRFLPTEEIEYCDPDGRH